MMPNLSARAPGPSQIQTAAPASPPIPEAPEATEPQDVTPVEDVAPLEEIVSVEEIVPVEEIPSAAHDMAVQAAVTVGAPTSLPEVSGVSPRVPTPAAPALTAVQLIDTAQALRPSPASHLPLTAQLGMPSSSAEVREFVRQAAVDRGIDPDVAVRVVLSEGGVTPATWVGDRGSSFGPLQLHYGGIASDANAVAGLGNAFTAETRLNAHDLNTWRQQVQWALDRAARDGWGAWHGAAAAGIGSREGVGVVRPPDAGMLGSVAGHRHVSVPNQFAANLSVQEAYAACGPAAAVAVARFLGRSPTVAESLQQAMQLGWTSQGGMNGIANEKRLLDAMHIAAQLETPLNWRHVQTDASRGTPVIVSTPNHYWVIDDFDPISREYHVGQSGLAYRGGSEWMTAERIQQLGGGANGGLYIANPLAQRGAHVVTLRLDTGWSMSNAPATVSAGSAFALDPGWRPLDPGWSVAGAPAVATVADAPRSDRWWEDSQVVRPPAAPQSGPEWV